jgi:hypothetical protein
MQRPVTMTWASWIISASVRSTAVVAWRAGTASRTARRERAATLAFLIPVSSEFREKNLVRLDFYFRNVNPATDEAERQRGRNGKSVTGVQPVRE